MVENCDDGPKITINPNPSDGNINVRVSGIEDLINGSIITIIDGLSNVRLTQTTDLDQNSIDVSALNNGIYYLNWTGTNFSLSSILIINK
ncbi:MAG: T9SS type A sorting domain-containing protein [Saprospiraceae bacterium]|nr:T9SS type A sorting domain-containing protein [Saprospiraceae bacterium]